jgi:hypothetical protein
MRAAHPSGVRRWRDAAARQNACESGEGQQPDADNEEDEHIGVHQAPLRARRMDLLCVLDRVTVMPRSYRSLTTTAVHSDTPTLRRAVEPATISNPRDN